MRTLVEAEQEIGFLRREIDYVNDKLRIASPNSDVTLREIAEELHELRVRMIGEKKESAYGAGLKIDRAVIAGTANVHVGGEADPIPGKVLFIRSNGTWFQTNSSAPLPENPYFHFHYFAPGIYMENDLVEVKPLR